jgi:hypothetical protein
MFGRFIWRGPVSGIADLYGYHTETRRDLEFTGIQVGRFIGLGFLHAKRRVGDAQRRFPEGIEPSPYADYDVKDDDPTVPAPTGLRRAQDPPQEERPLPAGWQRAQDPPRSED